MQSVKIMIFIGALLSVGPCSRPVLCGPAKQVGKTGETGISLADGTAITAELNSSLDSKKVKPGQTFTAKTTQDLRSTDDRMVLPKGTKLIGHVAEATSREKGAADSSLAIAFDKAVLKDGQEVPLKVTIQALAAPALMNAGTGAASDLGSMNPGATSPRGTMGGSPASNPSMSGSRGAQPMPNNYPGSSPTSNPASADPGSIGGNTAAGQLAPNSKGVFGLDGIHLTPGVSSGTQVAVITSRGKNVHLDSGTRLLLVSGTQPPAPNGN